MSGPALGYVMSPTASTLSDDDSGHSSSSESQGSAYRPEELLLQAMEANSSTKRAGIQKKKAKQRKPRMRWTAALHAEFEAAVIKYGIKSVTPKQISAELSKQISFDCIGSHLQIYRRKVAALNNLSSNELLRDDHISALLKRHQDEVGAPPTNTPASFRNIIHSAHQTVRQINSDYEEIITVRRRPTTRSFKLLVEKLQGVHSPMPVLHDPDIRENKPQRLDTFI
ncbi:hypothetical protein J8273_0775 [Carpediemonas membranifera]|uniref:Myb-like domain-containing protein n=1 Tax=Carpediemonas membranifera TaxID=201153 RepID=A0A8J6EBL4_9EUKA|nr:hypothetical protein J8273_0775 [Carpediemonas membranifera]|eukprot:KAG9397645.1 hypothetical protein J8273_0775 [Carpediemonas membranifera]